MEGRPEGAGERPRGQDGPPGARLAQELAGAQAEGAQQEDRAERRRLDGRRRRGTPQVRKEGWKDG